MSEIRLPTFDDIANADLPGPAAGQVLGQSRAGRVVAGYRFGAGALKVSLLGGCHADEPVGPRFLQRLVAYLAQQPPGAGCLKYYQWWIVPHINPDGAERNRAWYEGHDETYDLARYLGHVVREGPGDDIEFGFPRDGDDDLARPENRIVYQWWGSEPTPFDLHVSLHGMAFAGGPWFLIEPAWKERCSTLQRRCRDEVARLGYVLHDVERDGEKGFVRIERGFCTRPNSVAMARYFIDRGDEETAARFRPSSMETIRALGGDPLTVVSEMPLFIAPGIGEEIVPGDAAAEAWRALLLAWRGRLPRDGEGAINCDAEAAGLRPMPIEDQMRLQWTLIAAGVEEVAQRGKQ